MTDTPERDPTRTEDVGEAVEKMDRLSNEVRAAQVALMLDNADERLTKALTGDLKEYDDGWREAVDTARGEVRTVRSEIRDLRSRLEEAEEKRDRWKRRDEKSWEWSEHWFERYKAARRRSEELEGALRTVLNEHRMAEGWSLPKRLEEYLTSALSALDEREGRGERIGNWYVGETTDDGTFSLKYAPEDAARRRADRLEEAGQNVLDERDEHPHRDLSDSREIEGLRIALDSREDEGEVTVSFPDPSEMRGLSEDEAEAYRGIRERLVHADEPEGDEEYGSEHISSGGDDGLQDINGRSKMVDTLDTENPERMSDDWLAGVLEVRGQHARTEAHRICVREAARRLRGRPTFTDEPVSGEGDEPDTSAAGGDYERCPSVHESGSQCDRRECHDGHHEGYFGKKWTDQSGARPATHADARSSEVSYGERMAHLGILLTNAASALDAGRREEAMNTLQHARDQHVELLNRLSDRHEEDDDAEARD